MLVHIQITEYVPYAGNVSDFFCLISTWNINEYISKCYNKFQDQDFINNLVDQDIFCLQETHCDLDQCLQLDDFSRPVHLIRPKLKQIGKRSGGLSVYIRNNIRPGVKFLEHETNDSIWVKLCKKFFGIQKDLFRCFSRYTILLKILHLQKELVMKSLI
jgi:hypothetical protein